MQCDECYDRSPQGSEKVTPEHSLDWREGFAETMGVEGKVQAESKIYANDLRFEETCLL